MKTQANSNLSFIDLLFVQLFGVTFLFVLAVLLITPPIDDQQKKPKAEFLITLTWDGQVNDDVDLWVQDPADNIMFFRAKEIGFMHLDRDDLGHIKYNQEIATIRGILPGEWVINTHMYSKRGSNPTDVCVRVDKLNPRFTTIIEKRYVMENKGDEVTVVRMTMNAKGKITEKSDIFKELAGQKIVSIGVEH